MKRDSFKVLAEAYEQSVLKKEAMVPGLEDYKNLGTANSGIKIPQAPDWQRVYVNPRGTYEVFASKTLKAYYDVWSD